MIKGFIFLLSIVFINVSVASTDLSKGEAVFNEMKCYICHGKKAEKKSLNVSEVIQNWNVKKIVDALKGYKSGSRDIYGFSKMMGGKTQKMDEAQIDAVAEYISSLGDPTKKVKVSTIKTEVVKPVEKATKNSKIAFVEYIVKKADTLSSIARDKYNNHLFWPLIYTQNKNILPSLDILTNGMKLLIPLDVDINNIEHVKLLTKSYLAVYREYKNSKRVDDARWLLYANYCHINSNILEEQNQKIDFDDIKKVKYYIEVLKK